MAGRRGSHDLTVHLAFAQCLRRPEVSGKQLLWTIASLVELSWHQMRLIVSDYLQAIKDALVERMCGHAGGFKHH